MYGKTGAKFDSLWDPEWPRESNDESDELDAADFQKGLDERELEADNYDVVEDHELEGDEVEQYDDGDDNEDYGSEGEEAEVFENESEDGEDEEDDNY